MLAHGTLPASNQRVNDAAGPAVLARAVSDPAASLALQVGWRVHWARWSSGLLQVVSAKNLLARSYVQQAEAGEIWNLPRAHAVGVTKRYRRRVYFRDRESG